MMKKVFLFFALLPLILNAQVIQADTSQLNFGDVFVGERDTLLLTLTNDHWDTLKVTGIKFYTIYNETPFSVSEEVFTLNKDSSKTIEVYFEPIQNIWHNSEMVVMHNAKSGFEAIDLMGQGKFPLSYYDTTENLAEEDLKKALNWKLKQNYIQLSYNAARDEMFMEIDNEKNNGQGALTNTLECVYTGTVKTGYSSRSNAQTTNPNFNTEHTFPQSTFNSQLPERSDIHHLFPTTNTSNSDRGSKPFGEVTNGTASGGGSFYSSTTYEPRDEQKGKTARAMLYFVIRYQDYGNHFSSQENILRDWHNDYLPDSVEQQRNEDIHAVQKNRNPFIDYPQLEERITNFVSNSSAPKQFALDILQSSIDFGAFVDSDTFDYVLVNRGNQTIDFSNFSLSNNTALSFLDSTDKDRSILPGDAIEIKLRIDTGGSITINENLTFDTNIPGSRGSFTIPIRGTSLIVSLMEREDNSTIKVYPNPLENLLYIEGINPNTSFNLFDAVGRSIPIKKNTISNKIVLSTQEMGKGIYYLEIIDDGNRVIKKLVK